ncbi:hypothetical protein LSH36_63g02020 [Paralvinella palmiformis]|uniref:Uncharacterized protein n=1 Tax=Paralvinella palmiformis TaxID=53620 RepID=A0AAD9K3V0_9ANNE|nr:hypothetical protein LSH36_63g02020 [Paralvinella palmiformis]
MAGRLCVVIRASAVRQKRAAPDACPGLLGFGDACAATVLHPGKEDFVRSSPVINLLSSSLGNKALFRSSGRPRPVRDDLSGLEALLYPFKATKRVSGALIKLPPPTSLFIRIPPPYTVNRPAINCNLSTVDAEARRNQLMKDMAQLRLQAEVSQLEGTLQSHDQVNLPPYLVPDATALLIDHLDVLKKESSGARDCIRWRFVQIVDCAKYLSQQSSDCDPHGMICILTRCFLFVTTSYDYRRITSTVWSSIFGF